MIPRNFFSSDISHFLLRLGIDYPFLHHGSSSQRRSWAPFCSNTPLPTFLSNSTSIGLGGLSLLPFLTFPVSNSWTTSVDHRCQRVIIVTLPIFSYPAVGFADHWVARTTKFSSPCTIIQTLLLLYAGNKNR